MKAETFFSNEDRQQISVAIKEVESRTAVEVTVMAVERRDSYPEGRILAGVVFGGLAALIFSEFFFADSLWHFAPLAIVLTFSLNYLTGFVPAPTKLFISQARLEEEVRKRALAAFYEKGLYKTRDASGVLFFISLFEHRVWILADKGIYEKIAPEALQAHAAAVAGAVKTGNAAQVLCVQIRTVGAILAEHFPIKSDDTNELTNEVMTG